MSHMPGQVIEHEEGETCQKCNKPAKHELCFQTDSFGSDYAYLCDDHIEEERKALSEQDTSGKCDWCKQESEKRYPRRDLEEGQGGRVYDVCRPCIDKQQQSWKDELEAMDDY